MEYVIFIKGLVVNNFIITLFLGFYAFIMNCEKIKLSASKRRIIDIAVIAILFIPFVPLPYFLPNIKNNIMSRTNTTITQAVDRYFSYSQEAVYEINNLGISFFDIIAFVLVSGVVLCAVVMFFSYSALNKKILLCESVPVFYEFSDKLNIKARLYLCKDLNSPTAYGILHKRVVLPHLNYIEDDIKNILLHELMHHKNMDILMNYISCFIGVMYWYNPMVHAFIRCMRLNAELYCDESVIKLTGMRLSYANTIINAAANKKTSLFSPPSITSSRKQIFRRINAISEYKFKDNKFAAVILLLLCIASAINICMYGRFFESQYARLNIKNMDLSMYFRNNGCFVLYDAKTDEYTIYNRNLAEKRNSPVSTFKLAIGINGLENNIITPSKSQIRWSGENYPFDKWNADQTLNSAMCESVNWYFQDIDDSLGLKKINLFINKIGYGSRSYVNSINDYWLENGISISPIEQTQFIDKLVKNQYEFSEENIISLFDSIRLNGDLYGKTGTEMSNGKISGGWFVGTVIKNSQHYTFALWMEDSSGIEAKETAIIILSSLKLI